MNQFVTNTGVYASDKSKAENKMQFKTAESENSHVKIGCLSNK